MRDASGNPFVIKPWRESKRLKQQPDPQGHAKKKYKNKKGDKKYLLFCVIKIKVNGTTNSFQVVLIPELFRHNPFYQKSK